MSTDKPIDDIGDDIVKESFTDKPCPRCIGTGILVLSMGENPCPDCNGTGQVVQQPANGYTVPPEDSIKPEQNYTVGQQEVKRVDDWMGVPEDAPFGQEDDDAKPTPANEELDKELDNIFDLDYGYEYRMSDYATSQEQEAEYEADGLAMIAQAKAEVKTLVARELDKAAIKALKDVQTRPILRGKGASPYDPYEQRQWHIQDKIAELEDTK